MPGPTMMMGAAGSAGSLKLLRRTNNATRSPGALPFKKYEAMPSCMRPVNTPNQPRSALCSMSK